MALFTNFSGFHLIRKGRRVQHLYFIYISWAAGESQSPRAFIPHISQRMIFSGPEVFQKDSAGRNLRHRSINDSFIHDK